MKPYLSGLLSLALCASLSGQAMATAPVSVEQQTLGETYISYYAAATDYVDVLRHMQQYDWYTLPYSPGEFSQGEAATLRAQAGNRVVYHEILDKLTNPWMSDIQKVKAIYDFPMYNFVRYDTSVEAMPSAYYQTSYDNSAVVSLDRGCCPKAQVAVRSLQPWSIAC